MKPFNNAQNTLQKGNPTITRGLKQIADRVVQAVSLLSMLSLFSLLSLTACTTTSSSETKVADIAGKVDPIQRAKIQTELAAEYYRMGKMAASLEAANKAIEVYEKYAPGYNMLALIHMELGQDDKANTAFERAVRLAPADSDVLNNYGWFICQRQDPKRSIAYFEQAVKNPLYATPQRALYNAGICARKANNTSLAESFFQQALQRDMQFAPAHAELADIAYAQARFKDAEASFARFTALVREPDANTLLLGAK